MPTFAILLCIYWRTHNDGPSPKHTHYTPCSVPYFSFDSNNTFSKTFFHLHFTQTLRLPDLLRWWCPGSWIGRKSRKCLWRWGRLCCSGWWPGSRVLFVGWRPGRLSRWVLCLRGCCFRLLWKWQCWSKILCRRILHNPTTPTNYH